MTDTAEAIMARTLQLLRDPDRVVKDPYNLYETKGGRGLLGFDEDDPPARGCLFGCVRIAAFEVTGDYHHPDSEEVLAVVLGAASDGWTFNLEMHGGAVMADRIEAQASLTSE
jgi:hypothetical protein